MNISSLNSIVITDLDGTLLNHHDYNYQAAIETIRDLQTKNIPIIFNTSKTYAETISLRKELNIDDPFIVENGSAIYLPKSQFENKNYNVRDEYWEIILGSTAHHIKLVLDKIKAPSNCITLLSDCSIEQTIKLTGLNKDQSAQAIARDFSQPFIWQCSDTDLNEFKGVLITHELTTLQGGRFTHILGRTNKGTAIDRLKTEYRPFVKTIVLGDSANDADMLKTADISVIVNSPSNQQLANIIVPTIQTQTEAPLGWKEGIETALETLTLQQES